ncbi:MAG: hypothetical protein ACP5LK_03580 [Candidatus Bipolaricaulaceae bacterium]
MKFSKHTFTQPQLIMLYRLKIKLGVTYHKLIDWLTEMPRPEKVFLLRLPHFTAEKKAFAGLEGDRRALQRISASLFIGRGLLL